MSVTGVIFDFNGTLFFDYDENRDAWEKISLKYRGHKFGEEEYLSMMGKTDRLCVQHILPSSTIEEQDRIGEEKEEIYFELCNQRKVSLEEDSVKFIKECKRRGIKVMIASSAPKKNMEWYIKNLGLDELFNTEDIVAGRDDIPSKPNPDIYLYTQKLGGLKGEECIAFEDAPGGLKAALGAGFKRVYGIKSPGIDLRETGRLAPLVSWAWVVDNIDVVLE